MKKLVVFITIVFAIVCKGQTAGGVLSEINYKDVVEIKGIIYLKSDSTLATGKIIHYNKKNVLKRYIIVRNGKPDVTGWVKLNNKKQDAPNDDILGPFLAHTFLANAARETASDENTPYTADMPREYIETNKNKYKLALNDMSLRNNISKDLSVENRKNIDFNIESGNENKLNVYKNQSISIKNDLSENFYPNGNFESKGYYLDGVKDGVWESYYENGQLNFKGSFNKGKKDGPWEEFHPNGKLKSKGSYSNGKLIEGWVFYNEAGKKLLLEYYN